MTRKRAAVVVAKMSRPTRVFTKVLVSRAYLYAKHVVEAVERNVVVSAVELKPNRAIVERLVLGAVFQYLSRPVLVHCGFSLPLKKRIYFLDNTFILNSFEINQLKVTWLVLKVKL